MSIRSLFIALLFAFILTSCEKESSSGSTPPPSESPSVTLSDTALEEAAPAQRSLQDQIADKLSHYYQDLEAEQLDESRYFAPVVEKFYSQTRQPREQIGKIIREGFAQVEDRNISLDISSLQVTPQGDRYVAEFSGHSSLTRSQTGSREEEDFHNRFVFDENLLIVEYGPAEVPASSQRRMSPAAEASARIYSLISALNAWDLTRLNTFIHPQKGLYYLTRPGAFDAIYPVKSFEEMVAYSPWMEASFKTFTCDLKFESLPDFDCEDFSKQGCFLDEVENYKRLSSLIDALVENELNLLEGPQIASAKACEKLVRLQLTQTEQGVALLFGQVDGEWYLLAVDTAIYDCSA